MSCRIIWERFGEHVINERGTELSSRNLFHGNVPLRAISHLHANKRQYFMQARYRHFECLAHCLACLWLVKGVAHIGNKSCMVLCILGVSNIIFLNRKHSFQLFVVVFLHTLSLVCYHLLRVLLQPSPL